MAHQRPFCSVPSVVGARFVCRILGTDKMVRRSILCFVRTWLCSSHSVSSSSCAHNSIMTFDNCVCRTEPCWPTARQTIATHKNSRTEKGPTNIYWAFVSIRALIVVSTARVTHAADNGTHQTHTKGALMGLSSDCDYCAKWRKGMSLRSEQMTRSAVQFAPLLPCSLCCRLCDFDSPILLLYHSGVDVERDHSQTQNDTTITLNQIECHTLRSMIIINTRRPKQTF